MTRTGAVQSFSAAVIAGAVAMLAILGLLAPPAGAAPPAAGPHRDYVGLVDPWVEADIGRYFFFQSASQPFGFVKLRPDTSTNAAWGTGYRKNEHEVKGFSHVHDWEFSGVQVMPTTGKHVPKTEGDTGWQSYTKHDDSEIAQPGYHRLHLDRYGITAELTSTDRVGMHRYTYDEAGRSDIIVNLGGTLGEAVMGSADVSKVSDREIAGFVTEHGGNTKLYFDIQFDKPFDSLRGWSRGRLVDGGAPVDRVAGDNMGVYLRYDHLDAGETVQMKVGLSLTGTDGARRNIAAELPGWDFDSVKSAAQRQWNEMLGRIDVRGGTHQQQVKFYTDLFHALCGRSMISDADGKYLDDTWNHNQVKQLPLDAHGRPKFAMYNSDALWLTQWNLNSILGMAYPGIYSSFVQSMVQMYKDGGLLPRGPVTGDYSLIMTSSPVTSMIAGAWNKGIRDFDIDEAYDAMRDAHSVGGLFDKGAIEYSTWSGSGGIRQYMENGYVPDDLGSGLNGGAGQTLEYANQDWALAQLARELHKTGLNASQFAHVEVSSQLNGSNFAGARAVDGRPIRSSISPPDNVEWASAGEQHPWIKLTWDAPRRVHEVVLSDRANATDNVNSGTLTFSDGSSIDVADIPADGADKVVRFAPRTVSWVKFDATGGSGTNVGLNEIEVWDDTDNYRYFEQRSRNWRTLFDPSTGFIRPRDSEGNWLEPFDPLSNNDFVEANAWQATWSVTHDEMGLANLMGGEGAFADKLNYAFERAKRFNFISDYGQGYVSYGNQPGLPVAHLFNYVGYPWLSQYWVRQVKDKTYGSIATNDGYGHHDEDQGQMGSISALMAMGLFEVTGGTLARPVYDITSPVFDRITISTDPKYYSGKPFVIQTHDNSAANMYIQRAELNDRPLDNAWFYHDQLTNGGRLDLWMGPKPNKHWGVNELPPSSSKSEGKRAVYATGLDIAGPDVIRQPYGSAQFTAQFTPEATSLKRAWWSVTDLDGSPTDKATIDEDGKLTVNRRDGKVLVTATNADLGPKVTATKVVTLDLDVKLLRGNAARWPGVTATASSVYSSGYAPEKVFDGVIGQADSGDWASAGEKDPWIRLDWPHAISADKIVLYDRPGEDDDHGGTLSFSDGTSIAVTDIPPGGGPRTVSFPMKSFSWVKFQVQGGSGPNDGLSEFEVYAVPSAPDAPTDVSVAIDDDRATVTWSPPPFDGGAPVIGYVVTPYRDGVAQDPIEVDESKRSVVVPELSPDAQYDFTVAAKNLVGTGPEGHRPTLAKSVSIDGPDVIRMPYGTTRFSAGFEPADTTLKRATWTVTALDGSPTDKATIDADGVLTVNHRDGEVVITATAADAGKATASRKVTIDLDPSLLRGNAARWPNAKATASSEYNGDYGAANVADGRGPTSREWASHGEQDPWVRLDWDAPVRADAIVLSDRAGVDDVHGGTLTFSDGSTVEVTGVPADGTPKAVNFPMKTFSWVRFQVEGGTGPNVGLAELEVNAVPAAPEAPSWVSAKPRQGGATVAWNLPPFDGGAPVTGFIVTPYRDGQALDPVTVDEDAEDVDIGGLTPGASYRFTVTATNLLGRGPESVKTEALTPG